MAIIKVADLGISSGVNKPMFEAWLSANFSIPHNTATLVPFDVVSFNDDNCFNTSTNRFITPSAGRYMFICTLHFDDMDDTDVSQIWFYKNGSRDFSVGGIDRRYLNQHYSPGTARNLMPVITAIIDLEKDDYIQPYAVQNQGANQNATTPYSYFQGFRLIGT